MQYSEFVWYFECPWIRGLNVCLAKTASRLPGVKHWMENHRNGSPLITSPPCFFFNVSHQLSVPFEFGCMAPCGLRIWETMPGLWGLGDVGLSGWSSGRLSGWLIPTIIIINDNICLSVDYPWIIHSIPFLFRPTSRNRSSCLTTGLVLIPNDPNARSRCGLVLPRVVVNLLNPLKLLKST